MGKFNYVCHFDEGEISSSMKNLVIILIVSFLISCSNKDDFYKKEILGNWKQISLPGKDKNSDFLNLEFPYGAAIYSFYENNIYEDKYGFFKEIKKDSTKSRMFLGTKAKYEIENNCLKFYNLLNEDFVEYKINKIKNDTLWLVYQNKDTIAFKKRIEKITCKETFDKVLISSSGCYGTCPVSDILIDRNGEVIFEGKFFTTKTGLYKSKMNPNEFNQILQSFQKANWKNLKNDYEANHTDDELITVVFIKDNKVVKKVTDYGSKAPEEFRWAYHPLRYLYQTLNLKPIYISKDSLSENTKLFFKLRPKFY